MQSKWCLYYLNKKNTSKTIQMHLCFNDLQLPNSSGIKNIIPEEFRPKTQVSQVRPFWSSNNKISSTTIYIDIDGTITFGNVSDSGNLVYMDTILEYIAK